MLKTLGEATGGYIGLMDMILREAAIRALEKGLKKIDKATLKEVANDGETPEAMLMPKN
jgi:DNA transposition AAA+ family ATPase